MKEISDIKGTNSEITQQKNRLLVLRIIKDLKVTSRIDIAGRSGLKQATITNITKDLIDMGYVVETGLIEGNNGRRVTGVSLNDEKMTVVVVRITGSYFACGIYNVFGDCLATEKIFTSSYDDFKKTLSEIEKYIKELTELKKNSRLLGIGLVLEGVSESIKRDYLVKGSSESKSVIENIFEGKLRAPVFIDKSSSMAAFYKWEKMQKKTDDIHLIICCMIGYTIDCSVLLDGKIIKGSSFISGDLGRTTINFDAESISGEIKGSINDYLSVGAVKKMVGEKKKSFPKSRLSCENNIRDILEAYYAKDPLAVEVYNEVAKYLAIVFVNMINFLDPDLIIFGDEIPNNEEFVEKVRQEVKNILNKDLGVKIAVFDETRITKNDVSMKGACRYIVKNQFETMKIV